MKKNAFWVLYHNNGFTLSEVLITLGIIGVVAAMTLPSLINATQKRELKTALEKNYSIASQALAKMNFDEGMVNGGNYAGRTFEPKYVKYFKVLKDCGMTSCVAPSNHENNDGTASQWYINKYKNFTKRRNIETAMFDDGQFYLHDGSFYMIENPHMTTEVMWVYITIDVNGAERKPNAWGHDLFTFEVMNNGKLAPMGAPDTKYSSDEYCNPHSSSAINGVGCTYKALTDANYWKNLP